MRFEPDSWGEALLRPLVMVAPDANTYVEIMAPDFRFVFALLLVALLAVLASVRARKGPAQVQAGDPGAHRPVLVLLATVAVAFAAWLGTTGNGRYFIAPLLLVGPVCVGLAALLPFTRGVRLAVVIGMVALQAFAVQQSAPWSVWKRVAWKEAPYLRVDVPAQWRERPATYVTLAAVSYSLVAPQFHPQSRWISLYNAPTPGTSAPDARRTQAFLSGGHPGPLLLLVPVVRGMLTPERLPNARVTAAMEAQLAPYDLAFVQPASCGFLAAPALADMELGNKTEEERSRYGFWLCELVRAKAGTAVDVARRSRHDDVFRVLETQCPRFFPAGGDNGSAAIPLGNVRSYMRGEMKAYVYDSGEVYYKYYRALDPVLIGRVRDVLDGSAKPDCARIRGRSTLPWDRDS